MKPLRIIFMGTPDFAVPSLEILIEHQYNVVAVITAPDKPKGRGQKLIPSPIKQTAEKYRIPVLQPTNLKSSEFIDTLKSYQANLQVVVAFRMLPEVVWSMPDKGTFNLHASMLPDYRGAAPIHWAIINGEKETGVTTFFLKHEIDTGNIILQEREPVFENDTTGSLSQRLMVRGAALVLKTVQQIETGAYQLTSQDLVENLPKAPKLFKNDCEVNWEWDATEIVNFIRGLNPFPSAWISINGVTYKLHEAKEISTPEFKGEIGDYHTDNKTFLYFKAKKGIVSIEQIQAPGKRSMTIETFLRGNNL
ncbi:MAG: methionyl-tRNA formyltransferase [Cyclobacteriaceae bacterium]|nr:MAG: methionyl-tRNA formyltransferase [Cyclobacteriaceae bacterium]